MFEALAARGEGAFIPFVMLGDPSAADTPAVLDALVAGGADALELGIPFSDPVADGPTIQAAATRALAAGVTPERCWSLLAGFRQRHPTVPVGLLVYANLVVGGGSEGMPGFYRRAADAGVDSVLVADVPALEALPFAQAARAAGVAPVLLAPPDAARERLTRIARLGAGYTYVLTRAGITGAREDLSFHQHRQQRLLATLRELGAPPPVFGFGISRPEHVRQALGTGAAGAISGSALVALLAQEGTAEPGLTRLRERVAALKEATRGDDSRSEGSRKNNCPF
jgi:tryptophan synthase alpha chain